MNNNTKNVEEKIAEFISDKAKDEGLLYENQIIAIWDVITSDYGLLKSDLINDTQSDQFNEIKDKIEKIITNHD